MKKILIVDDDAEFRAHLFKVLQGEGYGVDGAASAKEGLAKMRDEEFDVALLDYLMPGMSGFQALPELRRQRPNMKVIMLTAFATVENAVEAIKNGASDYLSKPFKIPELLMTIRRVLEEARFEESVQRLDFDQTLSSLVNPIRRNILKLLHVKKRLRLKDITRALDIEDHTKAIFHLKILRETGIVAQADDRSYALTTEGEKTVMCLATIEQMLQS